MKHLIILSFILLLIAIAVYSSLRAQTTFTSDQSSLAILKAAPGWGSLPTPVLESIARRLGNQQNAKFFLEVAGHAGLLPKVRRWNSPDIAPPDSVVHNWGRALSTYGTYPAEKKRYKEAQKAFEVSHLLYSNNPGNWVALAEVLIYQHSQCLGRGWIGYALAGERGGGLKPT